ncbi:hypothetical protein THS27_26320 [Thalassospira sp. MCCC 1A01428]|nr:hypothetical protein THS27_26320 [Thalassospira sp. MCCC 1A01428]
MICPCLLNTAGCPPLSLWAFNAVDMGKYTYAVDDAAKGIFAIRVCKRLFVKTNEKISDISRFDIEN